MIIASLLILFVYFLLLGCLILGWKNILTQKETLRGTQMFMTVLVPVRNEEKNIGYLLSDLIAQEYGDFEIIVIDDHSEDRTGSIVTSLNSFRIRYILNN